MILRPKIVIVDGIVIDMSRVAPPETLNIAYPITVSPSGRKISVREEHSENEKSPVERIINFKNILSPTYICHCRRYSH